MLLKVGTSSLAYDIALALNKEKFIDILLLQVPYTFNNLSPQKSKSHRSSTAFSPISSWHARTRVLMYVCRNGRLRPQEETADLSRDIRQITIPLGGNRRLSTWNIYDAQFGANEAGSGLDLLLNCTKIPFCVGGDFKL